MRITVLACLGALLFSAGASASERESLHDTLKNVDAEFFAKGFNECDLGYLDSHVSSSMIFYHDQGGVQDKSAFLENVRKYICNGGEQKPIRKRVPGTFETYPLYRDGRLYGALQTGKHQFYLRSSGRADILTSRAAFSHVWTWEKDRWLLSNVLSYEHSSPDARESRILKLLADSKVPAMALGVIEGGEIVSAGVFGDLKKDTPAPNNALFKVASLTKPIVSLVTLRLVAAGRLDLDEPLSRYWRDPDLAGDTRQDAITPRLVLTHQTGFPNWRWMTPDKKLQFLFTPGTGHGYSGEGFEFLRKALEVKFNTRLEALAQELVFDPAGMTDTHFWWDEGVDEERFALPHDDRGAPRQLEKYYEANAAANLMTTIEDYTRFLQFVMRQQAIMPKLYHEMTSRLVVLGSQDYFGLGWEIFTGFPGDEFALMHTGKDPGVNTLAIFFPKSRNGYVIFLNGDNALPVLEDILQELHLGTELWERRE